MNTRNSPQLAPRRREVASLAHQGEIPGASSRPWKIPQGSVCRELAAKRKLWRDDPLHDFGKIGSEQWPKIDLMEVEAWGAGERSERWRIAGQIARGNMASLTRARWPDRQGDLRLLGKVAHRAVAPYPAISRRLISQEGSNQMGLIMDFRRFKTHKSE